MKFHEFFHVSVLSSLFLKESRRAERIKLLYIQEQLKLRKLMN